VEKIVNGLAYSHQSHIVIGFTARLIIMMTPKSCVTDNEGMHKPSKPKNG